MQNLRNICIVCCFLLLTQLCCSCLIRGSPKKKQKKKIQWEEPGAVAGAESEEGAPKRGAAYQTLNAALSTPLHSLLSLTWGLHCTLHCRAHFNCTRQQQLGTQVSMTWNRFMLRWEREIGERREQQQQQLIYMPHSPGPGPGCKNNG